MARLLCLVTCGTSSNVLREIKFHLRPVEEVCALVKSYVHAWVAAHNILVKYLHDKGLRNYDEGARSVKVLGVYPFP